MREALVSPCSARCAAVSRGRERNLAVVSSVTMRIVVADDDPVSRRLVEYVITTRTGHEVVTVTDGDRALELALGSPTPDVLILDWVMPTMNGTEVCRLVRREPLPVQPYVLLITAKTKRDEVIEG